jgi:Family of unknown function (DUF6011)
MQTPSDVLRANLDKLSESDRNFAQSLLRSAYPSPKQAFWIEKLAARATQPPALAQSVSVGDMAGVLALFALAKAHLKRPAIVLQVPDLGEVRLSLAGPKARVPGSVNVTEVGAFGEARWFGRILADGTFDASRKEPAPMLPPYLVRFAASPAEVAAEHGRLTGRCCFCNRPLSDERSTAMGYGPVCATHYGLTWGTERHTFATGDGRSFDTEAEATRHAAGLFDASGVVVAVEASRSEDFDGWEDYEDLARRERAAEVNAARREGLRR